MCGKLQKADEERSGDDDKDLTVLSGFSPLWFSSLNCLHYQSMRHIIVLSLFDQVHFLFVHANIDNINTCERYISVSYIKSIGYIQFFLYFGKKN